MNKRCGRCKSFKDIGLFHKNICSPDGIHNTCKECRAPESKKYYEGHKEERLVYAKDAYDKDPDKFAERNRKNREARDPEIAAEYNRKSHRDWYAKEENRQHKSNYYYAHKDDKQAYDRKYRPERERVDLCFKIANRLRTRMNMALRKRYKSGSAVRDLGCSIEEFIKYIESFWEPGMSWDNYGNGPNDWSLDHTLPLSSFDLTNREEFLKACHYTNIRPMWHLLNMQKHAKVLK